MAFHLATFLTFRLQYVESRQKAGVAEETVKTMQRDTATTLKEKLKAYKPSLEEVNHILKVVAESALPDGVKDQCSQAVQGCDVADNHSAQQQGAMGQQCFTFYNYLTPGDWATLMNPLVEADNKIFTIAARASKPRNKSQQDENKQQQQQQQQQPQNHYNLSAVVVAPGFSCILSQG